MSVMRLISKRIYDKNIQFPYFRHCFSRNMTCICNICKIAYPVTKNIKIPMFYRQRYDFLAKKLEFRMKLI